MKRSGCEAILASCHMNMMISPTIYQQAGSVVSSVSNTQYLELPVSDGGGCEVYCITSTIDDHSFNAFPRELRVRDIAYSHFLLEMCH